MITCTDVLYIIPDLTSSMRLDMKEL